MSAARAALKSDVGLSGLVGGLEKLPETEEKFDKQHAKWCADLCIYFKPILKAAKKPEHQELSYGRAAKLVNVYLKALFLSDFGQTSTNEDREKLLRRTDHIHPPIDSRVLEALIDADGEHAHFWRDYSNKRWTNFVKSDYLAVICRVWHLTDGQLWRTEKHWTPKGND